MVDCLKISTLHMCVLISWYRFLVNDLVDGRPDRRAVAPCPDRLPGRRCGVVLRPDPQRAAGPQRGCDQVTDLGRIGGRRDASVLVSLLKVPTDYGLLCLTFLLLGAPELFVGAYTLMFIGSAAYLMAASVKWFGQMRAWTEERHDRQSHLDRL